MMAAFRFVQLPRPDKTPTLSSTFEIQVQNDDHDGRLKQQRLNEVSPCMARIIPMRCWLLQLYWTHFEAIWYVNVVMQVTAIVVCAALVQCYQRKKRTAKRTDG